MPRSLVQGFVAGRIRVREQRGCPSPTAAGKAPEDLSSSEGKIPNQGSEKRNRKNWVKVKKVVNNYGLGEDVGWDRVLHMAEHTLVGRAMGRRFALKTVVEWAEAHWKEHLGYVPVVDLLTKGWMAFHL